MGRINAAVRMIASAAVLVTASSRVATAQAGSALPGVAAFLSAVNSAPDELKALKAEKSLCCHDIHTVDIGKITNAGNSAVISRAIEKNATQIAELREGLKSNETVIAALAAAKVSLDRVIALDVKPGIDIHIFYR
jgi:hypothetical protein